MSYHLGEVCWVLIQDQTWACVLWSMLVYLLPTAIHTGTGDLHYWCAADKSAVTVSDAIMSVWIKLSEECFQQRELQPCTTLVYLIKCPASECIRLHFVIRLGCSLHVSWPYLPIIAAASVANRTRSKQLVSTMSKWEAPEQDCKSTS